MPSSPGNLWAWITFSAAGISAARSLLSAFVEKRDPLAYVVYAHLARHHPDEIDRAKLKAEIERFLDDPKSADFSWYLCMSEARARQAKDR